MRAEAEASVVQFSIEREDRRMAAVEALCHQN